MKLITAAIAAAALLCAFTSHAAIKSSKEDAPTIVLKRGSSPVESGFASLDTCEARKAVIKAQDALLREIGSAVYDCIHTLRSRIAFGPNPPPPPTCTTPKPAQESQIAQCPSPTVGTWSQTRDYTAAPYPTCWALGEWTPATVPAGICATPQTQVYACPEAGSDGRILESSNVSWPNCAGAGYQAPNRSLVVAVNTGTLPHYWRLASKLTDEKIWTQTGTVGAWTRASAIDWGTVSTPTPGTAKLTWTPSTENMDGTPAVITGYRLLYGTRIDALVRSIDTIPVSPTALTIEGLTPGPYFFAMQAYTAAGLHGPLSAILSVTIR